MTMASMRLFFVSNLIVLFLFTGCKETNYSKVSENIQGTHCFSKIEIITTSKPIDSDKYFDIVSTQIFSVIEASVKENGFPLIHHYSSQRPNIILIKSLGSCTENQANLEWVSRRLFTELEQKSVPITKIFIPVPITENEFLHD